MEAIDMQVQCPACRSQVEIVPQGGATSTPCPKCSEGIELAKVATLQYSDRLGISDGKEPRGLAREMHAQDRRLDSGTMVGPYRVLEFVGEGGMGAVYKALQTSLNRTVAIKVLPAVLAADPEFVARFQREGVALANLSHPNIVAVYDLATAEGMNFIAMEYVDGVTLRQHLHAQKPGPLDALKLVPQICDGLEYAHAQGVIHRDIKPENVLLDAAGRVKIADFGLARIIGNFEARKSMTRTNMVMGTMEYMAPEQRTSSKRVDHRADLYSLGVMIYEIVTGDLPIGRFALPSERAGTDAKLDEIVLRALEQDPSRRYQSAAEVRADVVRILGIEAPTRAFPARPEPAAGEAAPARGRKGREKALGFSKEALENVVFWMFMIAVTLSMMGWSHMEIILIAIVAGFVGFAALAIKVGTEAATRKKELELEIARVRTSTVVPAPPALAVRRAPGSLATRWGVGLAIGMFLFPGALSICSAVISRSQGYSLSPGHVAGLIAGTFLPLLPCGLGLWGRAHAEDKAQRLAGYFAIGLSAATAVGSFLVFLLMR